ncbi:hypothetical protein AusDCA_2651 [Desulfitobacterium sp. AusDCA]
MVAAVSAVLGKFDSVFYVSLDVCFKGTFCFRGCTFLQKYTFPRKEGEFAQLYMKFRVNDPLMKLKYFDAKFLLCYCSSSFSICRNYY